MWDLWWTQWQQDKIFYPKYFGFSWLYDAMNAPYSFVYHRRNLIGAIDSAVK